MENAYQHYKEQLNMAFDRYCEKNAVVYLKKDGGRLTLTYGQLKEAILGLGKLLSTAHLRPFDRIAVLSPHTPFAVLINIALSYLGYTAVPIDISLPAEEINRLLAYTEVSAIFAASQFCGALNQSQLDGISVFEIKNDFTCSPRAICQTPIKHETERDSDVIVIIFSSGTTGSMKGIQITYTGILYAFQYLVQYTNLTDKAAYLNVLPSNHIVGYSIAISCILRGSEVGFLEDPTPQGLSRGFLAYNPTNFVMIPKVYEVIQEKINAAIRRKPLLARCYAYGAMRLCGAIRRWTGIKLRFLTKPIWSAALGQNMRICGCGAAPCRKETAEFYLNLGIDFVDVYGSTEACFPITAANCNDKYPSIGSGTVDQFPEIKVQIFRADRNGVGEIRVKTPMIMKGYFKDPELTAAAFDEHGYFKTGDLGFIDDQNNLHVTGRIKESILLANGKKVSPADIDAYYSDLCDGIRIASCGVRRADGFDAVHLFLETRNHSRETIDSVCRRILARSSAAGSIYKISAIHEIDRLPLTSIGKVKRFLLKETAEKAGTARPGMEPQPDGGENVFDAICKLIMSISDETTVVNPNSRLKEDLGMDSLNIFELCVALEEKFGVPIEPYLHDGITAAELEQLVRHGGTAAGEEYIEFGQYPLAKTEKDMRAYRTFMALSKRIWKMETSGLENLRSGEKYIFCPNHESYLDGMWIVGNLDDEIRRDICSLAASHLFEHKIFRRGLVVLGGIPTHRSGNTAPAMKRAYECLISGNYHLLIHPEGTRSRSGKLGEFKQGAAKLSMETGVKIIPVCINGAYEIFPPHRRLPRLFDWKHLQRYPLQVHFGTSIDPEGKTAEVITGEVREQIVIMKQGNRL